MTSFDDFDLRTIRLFNDEKFFINDNVIQEKDNVTWDIADNEDDWINIRKPKIINNNDIKPIVIERVINAVSELLAVLDIKNYLENDNFEGIKTLILSTIKETI